MNSDFIYFVISGFILMLLPIGFIGGIWLRSFFFSFLKVKASAGRLVLVRIRSKLRDYYKPGEIIDGALKVTSANKESRTLALPDDPFIYKSFGVNCVDMDEEKNCIFLLDGRGVSGYDAEKYDDLILRALLKPALHSKILKVILVLLIFTLIAVIAVGGMEYQLYKIVSTLGNAKIGSVGAFG